jgi:phospholipase C
MLRKRAVFGLVPGAALAAAAVLSVSTAGAAPPDGFGGPQHGPKVATATPIQHLVVITGENISFDHYFGTYPVAANTDGQPFSPRPGTPAVDGLAPATDSSLPAALQHTTNLLTNNANSAPPQRLDSSATGLQGGAGGELTCDQDNHYGPEQAAFDGGAMDGFVPHTGTGSGSSDFNQPCQASTVMDYYDGNTVTAMWNYAQHFAMSDNSYETTFGGTGPGHINIASGNTTVDMSHHSGTLTIATAASPDKQLTPNGLTTNGQPGYSLTNNANPYWDDCSLSASVALSGTNIGDELNAAGVSWGYFKGGFGPTTTFATATGGTQATSDFIPHEFVNSTFWQSAPHATANEGLCNSWHAIGAALNNRLPGQYGKSPGGYGFNNDLSLNQNPFQFYESTANPHHLSVPTDSAGNDTLTGLETIGWDTQSYVNGQPQFDTPNHQYDMTDFDQLVAAINSGNLPPSALPAVTFLKAPTYETGHAADSDPADEQQFVVREINALEQTPDWAHTAVIVAYDDSDGWYDHAYSGITNPSLSVADALTGTGKCGPSPQTSAPLGDEQGRCGFGPRMPLLVISPCAAPDYVDHNLSDQSSIINFIEYNWGLPGIPDSFDQVLKATDKTEGIPFDLAGLFNFSDCNQPPLMLNPDTGQIAMANAHLHGDNQGSDWANGDLSGTKIDGQIEGSFLAGANLTGADLTGVQAQGADFAGANVTGTNLQHAQLQGANLNHANLTDANLRDARTFDTSFSGATWSNTTCPDGTNSNGDGNTCQGHLSHDPPGP